MKSAVILSYFRGRVPGKASSTLDPCQIFPRGIAQLFFLVVRTQWLSKAFCLPFARAIDMACELSPDPGCW